MRAAEAALDAADELSSRLLEGYRRTTRRGASSSGTTGGSSWGFGGGRWDVETNYVLFSLRNDLAGVSVGALTAYLPLCRFESNEGGALCEWIGGCVFPRRMRGWDDLALGCFDDSVKERAAS